MHTTDTTRQPQPVPQEAAQEGTSDRYSLAHRDVDALSRVADQLAASRLESPPARNEHDAFAKVSEQVAELWALTLTQSGKRTRPQLQRAAVELAVAAVRFLVDVADQANPTTDALLDTLGEVDRLADAQLAAREDGR